ncbi:hypothetical protein CEXT_394051 [Caerostris extrusa]|uniref:Uncharacterized protein n=1 Tax=Caerostris extrusa TaxID=172846 RepID=A0AAV4TZN3_CAEEX|nr:hypothetical protein CEXT_394051 [Caerostris extrusa]
MSKYVDTSVTSFYEYENVDGVQVCTSYKEKGRGELVKLEIECFESERHSERPFKIIRRGSCDKESHKWSESEWSGDSDSSSTDSESEWSGDSDSSSTDNEIEELEIEIRIHEW